VFLPKNSSFALNAKKAAGRSRWGNLSARPSARVSVWGDGSGQPLSYRPSPAACRFGIYAAVRTVSTGDFLNSDDSGLTTNIFLTDPRLFGVRITKNW